MAKKLYYEDAYMKEFEASVLSCEKVDKGYNVVLDETAFYPEGGGQPCDFGTIDGIAVVDVQEKNDEVVHTVTGEVEVGKKVKCVLDWERRFDLMQQHSGEHIVSGIIHEKFGYDNVGFHMGEEMITVDLNGMITAEELAEIEDKANDYIWKNIAVNIFVPSKEELAKIDYRSKKELEGDVRLVEFPDADMCACCGTHIASAGEIGLVKLVSVQKFHEGVRIEMLCGKRAVKYLNDINEQNKAVSVMLSAKVRETAGAVKRLADENAANRLALAELQKKMFAVIAEKYEGKGNVLLFETGLAPDAVRNLASELMETCGGRAAVFSGDDENGYKYAIGEKDGNLRDFAKEMNTALNGRGGGKPFLVQGSVNTQKENIEEYFSKL